MKKGKLGYTLVEVSLFLAISAALFVGVTVGVQTSISNQRYSDSVQSYMEFLRGVYAGVLNVQNEVTGGKSDQAIYGKLVTFGEKVDLAGNAIGTEDDDMVFVYTVLGNISDEGGDITSALARRGADVARVETDPATNAQELKLVGFPESYRPKWGTQIEKSCAAGASDCAGTLTPLDGMLLVVRHPISGVVYTLFKETDTDNQINRSVKEWTGTTSNTILSLDGFEPRQIDFCVRPLADAGNRRRSDVRIVRNARNASGIELISEDDTGSFRCGW